MNTLELLAVIGMSTLKNRSELDPIDFYGIGDHVTRVQSSPVEELKLILKRQAGVDWDGKKPLWQFLIDECRTHCMVERAHQLFGGRAAVVDKAYRYLKAYERMTNWDHEPGSDVLIEVERARQIVIGAIEGNPDDERSFENLPHNVEAA